MSARIRHSTGAIAFVSALFLSIFGASLPADAADCLTAPNSAAPENSHWYYRMDRATQRKCWYLRAADKPARQEALRTALASPAADAYSLASFKAFIAQRSNADMSDEDIKRLYVQFLEWRHDPGNGAKPR